MEQAVEQPNQPVTRDDLKKIRVHQNGIWQYQPHLHFMQEMYPNKEEFAEKVGLLRIGGRIMKNDFWFKMDIEE